MYEDTGLIEQREMKDNNTVNPQITPLNISTVTSIPQNNAHMTFAIGSNWGRNGNRGRGEDLCSTGENDA